MTQSPTIGMTTISDVCHSLINNGVSKDELIKLLDINATSISDLDARVPASVIPKIWDVAIKHFDSPSIGLEIGKRVNSNLQGIVAQVFSQSENLEAGLKEYQRFCKLVNESVEVRLISDSHDAKITFSATPSYFHISEMERTLVSAVTRARQFVSPEIKPTKVTLNYKEPCYAKDYSLYFNCDVSFEEPETAILFPASFLKKYSQKTHPFIFRTLTKHAENLLTRLQPESKIIEDVYQFIRARLSCETIDAEMAAKHLCISRHTLYRKLKKHGLSFQSMVESVRQSEAIKILGNSSVSVSEAAFVLGFSELSAFSRAFKRWTGKSPAQFRVDHLKVEIPPTEK